MSFNLAIVEGHLGRDPELKQTSGGKSVANFSVGSDYGWGDSKATQWDSCIAWNDLADKVGKYLKKGSGVLVVGERRTRSWDDKQTGEKKYITEIHASEVRFLEKSGGDRSSAPSRPAAAPVARPATTIPEDENENFF